MSKTYRLKSNPVASFPVGTPFYVFVPGVDAHANLRAGADVTFANEDGSASQVAKLQSKSTGQLGQLAPVCGGQHYAPLEAARTLTGYAQNYGTAPMSIGPSDYSVLADELEAAFADPEDNGPTPSTLGRLYTALFVLIPNPPSTLTPLPQAV